MNGLHVASAAAAMTWLSLAFAQTTLPETSVSATRIGRDALQIPAAVDVIDGSTIRDDRPQINVSETLNRVPGIYAPNRGNYAQDQPIISRGYGARSAFGVRGVRLIADGIPQTMPDGQGQTASFDLSSADRIEVLRGNFANLYGNAPGGVIQLFTADGPAQPTVTGGATFGSYGTSRYHLQAGGTFGTFNTLIDASRFQTDGYRSHSAATREQFNAKLKFSAFGPGVLTVIVNGLDQPEAQDPLGLTRAQVMLDPRQSNALATAFNTGKAVRQGQLGATYAWSVDGHAFQVMAYGGDRQVTQRLAIPLAAQAAPTSSGGVIDLARGFGGAGFQWSHTWGEVQPLTLTANLSYDVQNEARKGYINDLGVTGALKRDEHDRASNTNLALQAEWQATPRWALSAGLLRTRVAFRSSDYFVAAGNPDDSGAVTYAQWNPVAGAVFRATDTVSLYGSLGRGFETPTFAELAYRPGGASGLNFALQPARSRQAEIGFKYRPAAAMRATLALFTIATNDEIVIDTASGGRTTFTNAARTRRDGVELSAESALPNNFNIYAAGTWLDARYAQPFASGVPPVTVPAGNQLPGVPAGQAYAELRWRHPGTGFRTAMEGRAVTRVFVNDANSQAAPGYALLAASAGFTQKARGWTLSEFVRVDNLANRQYVGSVIVGDANGRYYEPAPGRNWFAGVNAALEF